MNIDLGIVTILVIVVPLCTWLGWLFLHEDKNEQGSDSGRTVD
ncbi:MAG: hypothetical protein ABI349_03755 [Casimicrobiaceae bacterium]